MTGFPGFYTSLRNRNADDIWARLEHETAYKSIMAAGTHHKDYTNGLVGGHAYALLGTHKLSNGTRLVKLVNPHGVDVYKGDWSDKSELWTTALRKEVASVLNETDGVFFQSVEQFVADWSGFWISINTTGWKKSTWLNLGRDLKSSVGATAVFCKTANCRGNKFNLDSAVTQKIWIGIGTHDTRDYVGCTLNKSVYQYVKT